jgi:hypothetical protein
MKSAGLAPFLRRLNDVTVRQPVVIPSASFVSMDRQLATPLDANLSR